MDCINIPVGLILFNIVPGNRINNCLSIGRNLGASAKRVAEEHLARYEGDIMKTQLILLFTNSRRYGTAFDDFILPSPVISPIYVICQRTRYAALADG